MSDALAAVSTEASQKHPTSISQASALQKHPQHVVEAIDTCKGRLTLSKRSDFLHMNGVYHKLFALREASRWRLQPSAAALHVAAAGSLAL